MIPRVHPSRNRSGKLDHPGPEAGGKRIKVTCQARRCGREFWARECDVRRGWAQYGSTACSAREQRSLNEEPCAGCGKPLLAPMASKTRYHLRCVPRQPRKERVCAQCGREYRPGADCKSRRCERCRALPIRKATVKIAGITFGAEEIDAARGASAGATLRRLNASASIMARSRARGGAPSGPRSAFVFHGEKASLNEWGRRCGVSATMLSKRLKRGEPLADVIEFYLSKARARREEAQKPLE